MLQYSGMPQLAIGDNSKYIDYDNCWRRICHCHCVDTWSNLWHQNVSLQKIKLFENFWNSLIRDMWSAMLFWLCIDVCVFAEEARQTTALLCTWTGKINVISRPNFLHQWVRFMVSRRSLKSPSWTLALFRGRVCCCTGTSGRWAVYSLAMKHFCRHYSTTI